MVVPKGARGRRIHTFVMAALVYPFFLRDSSPTRSSEWRGIEYGDETFKSAFCQT